MIDNRCCFPQELTGGAAGFPCARWKPGPADVGLSRVQPRTIEDCPDRNKTPFAGTANLPWRMARARSTGCLKDGSTLHRVMKLRTETNFEALVKVMVEALPMEKKKGIRYFKQPYNAHRETIESNVVTEEQRRKIVLQVLLEHNETPGTTAICDLKDLAICPMREWTQISRKLGGISHGQVMRCAMEYVQTSMSPMDRAGFWAGVGTRQRIIDHGKSIIFPSDMAQTF
jgi:hypothetical protein|mmetsp:Transcript_58829/g.93041  ORF Transcript_58829/g.93041 Transcript_58829/m.93041 type:complete len:229 (-) Transcript_58829:223-909(-)